MKEKTIRVCIRRNSRITTQPCSIRNGVGDLASFFAASRNTRHLFALCCSLLKPYSTSWDSFRPPTQHISHEGFNCFTSTLKILFFAIHKQYFSISLFHSRIRINYSYTHTPMSTTYTLRSEFTFFFLDNKRPFYPCLST